ncbi:hypothetical protein [Pseudonocardia spirodelae]|uniref:Uncharacterized protein n=1 Tax=Pseudonocardia spirodelae TaxID=3133431 RepID=A0ABU8T9C2_9PSEU
MARPGTFDRFSAALAASGAVVVGGWFAVTGIGAATAGAPPAGVAVALGLAALAVLLFGGLARRSWRRGRAADTTPVGPEEVDRAPVPPGEVQPPASS